MHPRVHRTRCVSDEAGAALVEFAIVAVLLVTLVAGSVTYGVALGLQQSVTHAAASAARTAIVVPEDQIAGQVDAIVNDQLSWLGSRAGHVNAVAAVATCPSSDARCVTVTVAYPYADQPIVPSFLGLPLPATVQASATLALEPQP